MFSDDTVQELFMMASSENSAPQRFLILWKLRRHPQNTVSLSFFKWTPPKKYMLSSENVAMLFIFLEAGFIIYIQNIPEIVWCTFRIFWLPHEPSVDICGSPEKIRMTSLHNPMVFFFPQAGYMAYRIPPKNHFTRKTQITHVTHKKRTSAKSTKSFCWFPAFMVNIGKLMFLTWLDSPLGVYGATFFRHHKRISTPSIAEFMP